MKPTDVGRLLRLSLAPTAAADAVAGVALAIGGVGPFPAKGAWLVASSLCVYHGALAWNDWNDRDHDARTRPGRPLPSGAVTPLVAAGLGAALVLGGVACAAFVSWLAAAWMAGVAALALLYDFAGRGPWLGPLLIASCRAGNLACAIVALPLASGTPPLPVPIAVVPPLFYGVYVFLTSRLGRMEDAEDAAPLGSRPRTLLIGIALVPVLSVAVFATSLASTGASTWSRSAPGLAAAAVLAGVGMWTVAATALRTHEWTRAQVERAMGACLRRLLIVTAIAALLSTSSSGGTTGWLAAAAILGGYPIAHALRRAFPPS